MENALPKQSLPHETDGWFRRFAEHTSDTLLLVDRDMQILYVSPAFEEMHGVPLNDIRGQNCHEAFHAKGLCEDCAIKKAIISGHVERTIRKTVDRHGRHLTIHTVAIPLPAVTPPPPPDDPSYVFLEVGTDITAVTSIQEEASYLLDLWRGMASDLPDSLIILDENLRAIFANTQFVELRGLDGRDIAGQHVADIFPTPLLHREGILGALHEALQTESPFQFEGIHYSPPGRPEKILEIYIKRITAAERIRLMVTITDITDREKRIHHHSLLYQLSKSIQSLDLDRVLFSILTCVTAGPAMGFSRAFLLLLREQDNLLEGVMAVGPKSAGEAYSVWGELGQKELSLDDILGRYDPASAGKPLHPIVSQMTRPAGADELLAKVIRERRSYLVTDASADPRVSPELRTSLGQNEFVAVPIIGRQERVIGILLADNAYRNERIDQEAVQTLQIFSNQAAMAIENAEAYRALEEKISELAASYRQLTETQDRLIRSERLAALGKLSAYLAHEIRNPLSTIGGFARSVLKSPEKAERNRRSLEIIVKEVERLEELLTTTLRLSQSTPLPLKPTDINLVLSDILDVMKEECDRKSVSVSQQFAPEFPPIPLDAGSMRRVFLNLIQNALQAMPQGGALSVSTSVVVGPRDDGHIQVEFSDNGVGIPAEKIDRLFNPFFTTKEIGSGMGLVISQKIVEDHGGRIIVHSGGPGKGATFRILLPLRHPAQENQG